MLMNDSGDFVERKTKPLDATSPSTYEYSSADPRVEKTFMWTELYLGLGENIAPTRERPRRYRRCQRADLSIDGMWMKGPNFEDHVETIHASAGEVRQLVEGMHGGTLTLFAVCENGVYRRTSDGVWTASLTAGTTPALPGGQKPQQAVRFKGRNATPVDALYLGTNNGNLWEYDGSAWSQAGTTAGPGTGTTQGEARYVERIGDELWVAGDYWVVKVEADPMVRLDYAGVIYVGDQTAKITWLKQVENTLFIFKEDGIYVVDSDGLDQELFPHLRYRRNVRNGRNATVWIDQLWAPYGDQLYRLSSSGTISPDGIELLLENSASDIQGRFVAGAGHNTWFFYEAFVNTSGHSYLLKHGTWLTNTDAETASKYVHSAHHGTLAEWTKEITCMEIVPDIHPSGNDRLYIGFADGTVEWCVLPKSSPNPMLDANCEFTYLDSYVYLPIHHSNFQADNKLYMGVSVFGQALTNSEWVEVEYKADLSNPLAEWTLLDPDDPRFTLNGQRRSFPEHPEVYSKAILFRVKLVKNADDTISLPRLSPVVDGIFIHEQVRPSLALEYTLSVKAGSYLPKYNGMTDRRRGSIIRDLILDKCASVGTTIFLLPDGEEQELTIVDYNAVLDPMKDRRDLAYQIQIKAIQLVTITPGTQFSGLTYATLEQYTLGQLESFL